MPLSSTSTSVHLAPIPPSTAYRALVIDELQRLIFPQLLVLRKDGRPSLKQPDLISLAATCRAFSEVALDLCWRHCRFCQLIRVWEASGVIFPRDAFIGIYLAEIRGFKREPNLEDWKRLEYYARRIHSMRLDFPYIVRPGFARYFATLILERSVLPTFRIDGRPPLPLFPKLDSLELEIPGAVSEVLLCTTIIEESPVLDSFEVIVYAYFSNEITPESWIVMFASLGKHGRPLKRLAIRPEKRYSRELYLTDSKIQLTTGLTQLIDRTKLEELVLPRDLIEDGVILNSIPYLPTLKTLEVRRDELYPYGEPYNQAPIPQNAFSSLECLRLHITPDNPLLNVPSLRSLTKLVILGNDCRDRTLRGLEPVREVIMAVSQNCPTLEVLYIYTKLRSLVQPEASQPSWPTESIFAPLQACSRLQDVRFDFSETSFECAPAMEKELDLSDEQWEQLALAWPDLRSMWLYAGPRYDEDQGWVERTPRTTVPRPRATLRTIASLVYNCPSLSRLRIPVFARGEEARAAPKIGSARDPVQLDLRGSWIDGEDMQDVAIFLASLAQKTDIQVSQSVSHYELNVEVQGAISPEERTLEIARRDDWQRIKQLVDCAQNSR